MTSGAVWKVILRFAFPLLIGNLLQQLYNVTDSVIVGQFLGKESLAAVSASFFIYYFIISLVIGIGSGTSVVISQFFGAKKFDKVQKAFSSFFIFMLVAGVLLSIAGIIFAEPMFRLTNTPEDVIPQAVAYFRIYVGGTFLFVTFNSIISILRGVGESVRPMLFILLTTILNIALDLLFIVVFKWGIEGAARATVIAQGIGMCVALGYVNNTHPRLSDTIIIQAGLTLSGALAAFCGQNIGAGHLDRVRDGVRFAMLVNLLLGLATFTAIYFFGDKMMLAFTKDPEVIRNGK